MLKLPPVTLPVALTTPPVFTLPPVMVPVALINPVIYSPVVAYTAILFVPPTPIVTLPSVVGILTLEVPLTNLLAVSALATPLM